MKIPPDPEKRNDTRAAGANVAVRAHADFFDAASEPFADNLADLLCNLAHLADRNGIDFASALSTAKLHYEAETNDRGRALRNVALE